MLGQYNLTARLLGDPRPDRFEKSEYLRSLHARSSIKPEVVINVVMLCKALINGPLGASDVAEQLGCSPSAASDRAKRSRSMGLTTLNEFRNAKGRFNTYALTDAGRAFVDQHEGGRS